MAHLITDTPEETVKEKTIAVPQKVVGYTVQKTISLARFIMLYTSIIIYYIFAGLTVLIRGKVPEGYVMPDPTHIDYIVSNLDKFTITNKESRKYGRVVDLDIPKSTIDILR